MRRAAGLGKPLLDVAETAREFGVGAAKRLLGIDLGVTGEIGHGEQEIADLVLELRRGLCAGASELGLDLRRLLANFFQHETRVGPIETDRAGLLLQLHGARQRGQGRGHAVEQGRGRADPGAATRAPLSPRP